MCAHICSEVNHEFVGTLCRFGCGVGQGCLLVCRDFIRVEFVSAGIVKSRRHGTLHRGFHVKADLVSHSRLKIHVLHQGLTPVCCVRFNLKYCAVLVPVNIRIVGVKLPAFLFLFKVSVCQKITGYFFYFFTVFCVFSRLGGSSRFRCSATRLGGATARLSCLAGCFHAEFRNLHRMGSGWIGFVVNIPKIEHIGIGIIILSSGISIAYFGFFSSQNSGLTNIQSCSVKPVLHHSVHRRFNVKRYIIGLTVF